MEVRSVLVLKLIGVMEATFEAHCGQRVEDGGHLGILETCKQTEVLLIKLEAGHDVA